VIFAVPILTPVKIPDGFTVAIAVLLLPHVPPVTAFVKVAVCPTHKDVTPEIAGRGALTVATTVRVHPTVLV